MNEEVAAARWLTAKLGDDATLSSIVTGVWSEIVPLEQDLPAVRFSVVARNDVTVIAGQRVLVILDFLVVGLNEGPSLVPLVPIADRIDVLLDRAYGTTDDLEVLACVRQESHTSMEFRENRQFRIAGGIYRTTVQAL